MQKPLDAGVMQDGSLKEINVDGREIVLARVNDRYYAADNRCPHMGGQLHLGKLEGTIVTCPRHGSQFDLKDGSVVRWMKGSGLMYSLGKAFKPPHSLKTYPVKMEGSRLMIDI
jgi:3-phenylpropionate/trans-cinnamate dioxygenase ferredoxin component